jgi:LemA protein
MQHVIVPLLVIAVILLIPLIWLIANYNRFVRLRQHIKESWADIDVEMKRRYELIPNVVNTVKGYAAHERDVLERVTELRNRAVASTGTPASQAADESALLLGLRQLFVVAENYPQLRADAHFLSLQKELANTEDRIAAARRFFNANVRDLNQLCQSFPTNLIAALFGITPQTYFELESQAERVVPRVRV